MFRSTAVGDQERGDPLGTEHEDDIELHCPTCSYDLRGIESLRCPECGFALDFVRLAEPQIPWVHRGQIGRIRAFWRTVWRTSRRPQYLVEELGRRVSEADAGRFRCVVVLHAYAAVAALTVVGLAWGAASIPDDLMGVGLLHFYFIAFAALATSAPAYLCRSRHRPPRIQARAAALSYYTTAPLAFLPLALAGSTACWALAASVRSSNVWASLILLGFALPVTLPLLWIRRTGQLARGSLRLDRGSLNRWGLKLLAAWTVAAIIPLLLLGAAAFVALVVLSLAL